MLYVHREHIHHREFEPVHGKLVNFFHSPTLSFTSLPLANYRRYSPCFSSFVTIFRFLFFPFPPPLLLSLSLLGCFLLISQYLFYIVLVYTFGFSHLSYPIQPTIDLALIDSILANKLVRNILPTLCHLYF